MDVLQIILMFVAIIALVAGFVVRGKALKYKTAKYPAFPNVAREWFRQTSADRQQWLKPEGMKYERISRWLVAAGALVLLLYIIIFRW